MATTMPQPVQYLVHPLDVPVRVLQWGTEGPPVLFIHGLGSHAEVWAQVGPRLAADGYSCFAIDLPGHGLSFKGAGFDHTASGHARLLAALLDVMALGRCHVVGSSLGGLHASQFVTSHPQLAASLTLVGAVGLETLTDERRQWTADYLRRMDRESVAGRLRRAVFDASVVSEAFVEEAWRMNNSKGAAESFSSIAAYYLDGINDDLQISRLAALDASIPVLLVWGREDVTVSFAGAQAASRQLPRVTLEVLERTCHIPQIEQPEQVHRLLARHFSHRIL